MKRNRGQSSAMKCSRAPVEGDPRPYRAIRRFAWPAQTECAKSVFLGEKPRAYSVAATAASRSEERRAPGKKRFCAASASASRYTGLCTHTRRRPAHVGARGQPQGTKPWHQAMAPSQRPGIESWPRRGNEAQQKPEINRAPSGGEHRPRTVDSSAGRKTPPPF